MKQTKVAVPYGGVSSEREVSLRSGATIIEALKKAGFSVSHFDTQTELFSFIEEAKAKKFDIVVPVLHGAFGEDGTLQGMLELLGLPYLFSDCLSSALCMDKELTKLVVARAGVPTLPQIILRKGERVTLTSGKTTLRLPVVVKPVTAGSSVGVSIVKEESMLTLSVKEALRHSDRAIIERYVSGRELTIGVVQTSRAPRALPITEIIANSDTFYSYDAKYAPGGSTHLCPAKIPKKLADELREYATTAFTALGCRDIARADFLVHGKTGKSYFLEMNTIPGMTATSLVPEALRISGRELSEVLKELVMLRLADWARKK